jgi:hypothetical protein
MSHRSLTKAGLGLLALVLALAGRAPAEDPILDDTEPPVRLKKKIRPDTDAGPDKKTFRPDKEARIKKGDDKEGKKDPDKDDEAKKPILKRPDQSEAERKKLVQRVLKNMRQAEERLAKNDPGRGTRDIQGDIVKDLATLIEEVKRNPPPQGGSQSQRMRQQRPNQRNAGKPQKNQGNNSGKGRNNSGQASSKANRGGRGGNASDRRDNKLADLYKDVWGHLLETKREEGEAAARGRPIPEYELLQLEYLRSLSEDSGK